MRIVSLLPSATEMLCELGLADQLVGVTHECDYPPVVRTLPKVTKTFIPEAATSQQIDALVRERVQTARALYSLDLPVLQQLQPELLVTQTLCAVCAVAESEVQAAVCVLPGAPRVVNLEPTRLGEVLQGLVLLGTAAGVPERAAEAVTRLQARIDAVKQAVAAALHRPRVVLLEWIDPPFCAGHWSPELVRLAGGQELLGQEGQPSRTVPWEEVAAANPEVLVIACCGFEIARTRLDLPILAGYPGFADLACVRAGQVFLVDGNAYFSRPGPRLVESLEMLADLLHPGWRAIAPALAAERVVFEK